MDDKIEERMELSDAPRQEYMEKVENVCWMCGASVWKVRKLPKARCFDCRAKYNNQSAKKHYHNKYKAL